VSREDVGSSRLPSSQIGRSVKDLLSAIGDVCDRYTESTAVSLNCPAFMVMKKTTLELNAAEVP